MDLNYFQTIIFFFLSITSSFLNMLGAIIHYYPALEYEMSYAASRFEKIYKREEKAQQERRDKYNQKFEDLLVKAKTNGQD
jgi:hypothetical protein